MCIRDSVDIDPALTAAANTDHPAGTWLARDLADLDLTADGLAEPFDVIVSAGNVMTFLDPITRRDVLHRLAAHLAPQARLVVGFGPESLAIVLPPHLPPELPERVWRPALYHDRAHNAVLDALPTGGILRLAAGLGLAFLAGPTLFRPPGVPPATSPPPHTPA